MNLDATTDAERRVIAVLTEVLAENGMQPYSFRPDTRILQESGMDSLGLALAIVKLEELTGHDPFADGFVHFTTVAELAALYGSDEQ